MSATCPRLLIALLVSSALHGQRTGASRRDRRRGEPVESDAFAHANDDDQDALSP
jgi:hypothetical protein